MRPTPIEPKEETDEPDEMIVPKDRSKRQIVFDMCDHNYTREKILAETKWEEALVDKYCQTWEKRRFNDIKDKLYTVNLKAVSKVIELMEKKQPVMVEGEHIYYPGRDKLTYIFMATTLIAILLIFVI